MASGKSEKKEDQEGDQDERQQPRERERQDGEAPSEEFKGVHQAKMTPPTSGASESLRVEKPVVSDALAETPCATTSSDVCCWSH